jgi:hypothetical protein
LEQAKRWESRAKELASHGDVPMEQLMVAQDAALMRQADVVAQKAALRVAELRLREAQRGISSERPLSCPSEHRLAEVERRLAAMEQTVRDLRQEAEHVRLELPAEHVRLELPAEHVRLELPIEINSDRR